MVARGIVQYKTMAFSTLLNPGDNHAHASTLAERFVNHLPLRNSTD
jgi:hypothetical protein